jgi:hypothetical protein
MWKVQDFFIYFFGFLNVSNLCGLYILTCNDSQQEGMWGKCPNYMIEGCVLLLRHSLLS